MRLLFRPERDFGVLVARGVKMLDADTKAKLLKLARATIRARLEGAQGDSGETEAESETWPEMERQGVFVTLRKAGQLRGCIGTFLPQDELPATIREMSLAAMADPRFTGTPISLSELPDIRIELSVLSPLEPIDDPLTLVPGTHGIYIKHGHHAGCFLPDVATERAWDAETFLSQCCVHKAGLPAKAWKDPDAQVFVFTVEKLTDDMQ